MVVVALPWAASALYGAAVTGISLATAYYGGSVAGKLTNSGIQYTKQNAPYWIDNAGQALSVTGENLKIGTLALGYALQESAEVTSAFVSGMANTARLAPPMQLAQTATYNPVIPFQRTLTASGSYVSSNPLIKSNSINFNYSRRLEAQPQSVPVPADSPTQTIQKPVVKVSQSIKAKTWGVAYHRPLSNEKVKIQNLNIDEALAQIPALSQIAADDLAKWLASEQGDESLQGHQANFLNTSIVYLPDSLKIGAFSFGTKSIDTLAEIYRTASDQATINQATIGVTTDYVIENKAIPLPNVGDQSVPLSLTHVGAGTQTQVKDSIIFPQTIETNVEDLLAHIGAQSVKKDGATVLGEGIDFDAIPNRENYAIAGNVLAGESAPEEPQKIKAKNVFDLGLAASAITYYRQGLHEYPMQAVSPTQVGQKVEEAKEKTVEIPNAATLQAYQHTVTDKKLGTFPLELEFKDSEGKTVPITETLPAESIKASEASVSESGNLLLSSMAGAMALVTTLGATNQKSNSINFGMLSGLAAQTAGAAAAAVKAAGCACAGLDAMGARSNPDCQQTKMPFDYSKTGASPKSPMGSISQFMGGGGGCFPSTVSEQGETMFDYLKRIDFAAQIIKQSSFKSSSQLDKEEEKIKRVFDRLKKNNKERWEKFKDAVKKEDSYLNKHYPVKPRIVERGADGLPKANP